MADYIDRQAAIEVLNKLARSNFTLKPGYEYYLGALHDAWQDIKYLPSADVEPVVRCKDCAYRNGGDYCHLYGGIAYEQFVRMTDFCSRGERMDGGDNAE